VRWRGRRAGELAEGRPAELVARPESLRLADAGGPGTLPGQVVERRFTGALAYATVRLENGAEIEVLVDPGTGVDAGDPVSVEPRAGALPFSVFPVEDE
jgi:hypothetical protein